MEVKFKLFASLRDYLPNPSNSELDLEVDETATPLDLMAKFSIPAESVHLILVNGIYIAPDQAGENALAPGDVLALWPPIAGG